MCIPRVCACVAMVSTCMARVEVCILGGTYLQRGGCEVVNLELEDVSEVT